MPSLLPFIFATHSTFSLASVQQKSIVLRLQKFNFDRPPTIPSPSLSMAAVVNGSFSSPIATADYSPISSGDGGLLSKVYNGMSGLSATVTVLLILVAYDQCKSRLYKHLLQVTETCYSQVCLEQGIDHWTGVENAFHWALLTIGEPQDGRIQGKVGEWRFELCFRLS